MKLLKFQDSLSKKKIDFFRSEKEGVEMKMSKNKRRQSAAGHKNQL